MTGMNAAISNNIRAMLKQNGKKQSDLAEAIGVSKQDMNDILTGLRIINAIELHNIANFFHVTMEEMIEHTANTKDVDAVHAFINGVHSDSAKQSLKIADEIADMTLFYGRTRANAEAMEQTCELV